MDPDDSESQVRRTVTGSHPVMPIPRQYLRQYYVAHDSKMDDQYSREQEGTNIYSLSPEHLALLHLKQQEEQMQNPPPHYIYYTPQQQHYLQQHELLKYRHAIQNPELNGHLKQKKFPESDKSQAEHQAPIKPKIKVEPEDEPKDEMFMDQDESSQEKQTNEEPILSQQRPPATTTHSQPQEFTHVDVKKRLQDFVLNKKQREQAVASLTNDSSFKHWSQNLEKTDDLAPLGSQHLDPSHFPLRKTASEPNLKVKSRLKAKVAEHRSIGSPLLPRPRDRVGNKLHRSQTLETSGNENQDRSNPGSPTQSMSASPGREGTSPLGAPLGAPGSTFGHSLPNLQAIPRLSANIDRSHINQLIRNRYMIHHPRNEIELSNNDYEAMEEEASNSLNAAALKRAQLNNIALAKAQMKMMNIPSGALSSNAVIAASPNSVFAGQGSPPSQNNLLSIPKTSLSASTIHRPLRQSLSAPGYSLSKSQQHQQILKQNQEILQQQQQQHLQFLQQQQRQSPAYLQLLQRELLMQQLGKQGFSKQPQMQQKVEQTSSLKDHLEMMQKEQEQAVLRERVYQQHKARATDDLSIPGGLIEQQLQQDIFLQQLQRQDVPARRNILNNHPLQHHQLIQLRQAELQEAPLAAVASPSASVGHRPLTRAVSLPAVGSGQEGSSSSNRTGIAYDTLMLKHQCSCGETSSHPEHPGRLQSIWARLQETGVTNICERVRPRKASLPEILTVHSEQHTMLYGGSTQCRTKAEDGTITTLKCFNTLPCGGMGVDGDTIWNEIHSANAARMAVGCVIELASKVAAHELKNGMAIVRPPGHHAEAHQAMGFCYFNNVAIAARILRLKMSVERVLIVDWDIHHGNGTQQMFYDDPHVLYISLHRHDDETFFPGTGKSEECGAGIGVGYNVNIAWNGGLDPPYGDPEYFAAFRSVVIPIAKEFQPDIVLVSAGFDAAGGHSPQLGGYNVTAACFAQLTKQLMELADGRIVMALEGGYSLPSLCDCAEACIRGLLSQTLPEVPAESLKRPPNANAVAVLEKTIAIQSRYWNAVKRSASLINHSMVDARQREKEELDTVSALASLSMGVVKEKPIQMEIQDGS